jgi:hypothetical protein
MPRIEVGRGVRGVAGGDATTISRAAGSGATGMATPRASTVARAGGPPRQAGAAATREAQGGALRGLREEPTARSLRQFVDRATQGVNAPRDLRVGHERGLFVAHVTRE